MPTPSLTRGCMLACPCQYWMALFLCLNSRPLGVWIPPFYSLPTIIKVQKGTGSPCYSCPPPLAGLCGVSWIKIRSQKEATWGTEICFPKGSWELLSAALTQQRQADLHMNCRLEQKKCGLCRLLQVCRQWLAQLGKCLLAGVASALWCQCQLA